MKLIRFITFCCVTLALITTALAQEYDAGPLLPPAEASKRLTYEQALETVAYTLGVQATLWGMQFVKDGAAIRQWGTPLPEGMKRQPFDPIPRGYHFFSLPTAILTPELRVLETPNTETIYPIAIIDLDNTEPLVVVHPDHKGRYFRTSVWDGYGEARTISDKQDGSHPKPYLIAPLHWQGDVPEGMNVIRIRSRLVVLGGHVGVYGKDGLPKAVEIMKGYKLIPLSHWGKSNEEAAPLDQAKVIHPLIRPDKSVPKELVFFEMLGETMKDIYEFQPDERAFVRQLKRIGITRRDGFHYEELDSAVIRGLKRAALDGQSIIEHKAQRIAPQQPGGTWMVPGDFTSQADWLFRAAVGWKYVWADLNSEVLYPQLRVDADGQPLAGRHSYTLHFAKGEHPQARFWRISMYDLAGFFIRNPLNRAGIGNMGETLDLNDDGSLTIYIQNESPGKAKETNWLPAPKEGFFLMLRMYQPEERMYSGDYIVPPVVRE